MIDSLRKAATLLQWKEFALAYEACPLCHFRLQVRLSIEEMSVRCLRCGASSVTQSLVDVLARERPELYSLNVYELSAAGPLVRWLKSHALSLTTSEFFPDVTPGQEFDGTTCQDVQRLTYKEKSFDVCTSTEVFEHVEDDLAGFREIFRVLRPGGLHVFSVPLDLQRLTIERTSVERGQRINLYPPEYHADRFRGRSVFCYRNYGADILQRLTDVGFVGARFCTPQKRLFGFARTIIVAQRPLAST